MSRKVLIEDDASQFQGIQRRLFRLESGIPEDVHYIGAAGEPAFQNSWVNFDAAAPPTGRAAGYYRDRGRVYLTGLVKTGASGTVIFTLPAGYRPLAQTDFTELATIASGPGAAEIRIGLAGGVTAINSAATAVATWVSLEGLSFRHA